jgi:(1->4)-alpha-D-glucan 1-alpha-D-glucosylmutase
VRARLAVLSQDPDHWVRTVHRWRRLTAHHVRAAGPGPAHQHLTFQTLVGAWPLEADRLEAYLLKAAREAARASDHLDPDPDYEASLSAYAHALIGDDAFRADLEEVVDEVRVPGWLTALSMVAVKLTAPGVPDIYQGDELWDLSLVDPDNRRPVDVTRRREALAELETGPPPDAIMEQLDEGLPKLHLIRAALRLRARRPGAFSAAGAYEALWPRGARADHAFAYLRGGEVAVVTARRVRPLGPRVADWDWRDTVVDLPQGEWVDALTGARHDGSTTALAALLTTFPVALLEREELAAEGSSEPGDH